MTLRQFLRSRDEVDLEPDESQRERVERELRRARLDAARRMSVWREVRDLVRRDHFYVDAASDEVFVEYRGAVFQTGSTSPITDVPLVFVVDEDGDLKFLEARPGTWSEHVARRVRREHRRNTPRRPAWLDREDVRT